MRGEHRDDERSRRGHFPSAGVRGTRLPLETLGARAIELFLRGLFNLESTIRTRGGLIMGLLLFEPVVPRSRVFNLFIQNEYILEKSPCKTLIF